MDAMKPLSEKYDHVVLVLQGGGALGAYHAGAYAGMAEAGYAPSWVTGVSIGAINAALIAGNPPERRVERLRGFWDRVSCAWPTAVPPVGDALYAFAGGASAALTAIFGVPGFFVPRLPPAPLMPDGDPGALSVYDMRPLEKTLEELVQFDLINAGEVRLSLGAVDVRTGNSTYFDNTRTEIGPRHVMASSALPPAFAPVEIDGRHYWDGGIVSNTPLWYVLDESPQMSALIIQVDLFGARGELPQNLDQVMERHKDIMYSSKTRFNTTRVRELQEQRRALHRLRQKLPESLRQDPDARVLEALASPKQIDIVHLINRRYRFTSHAKDYEFSAAAIREHWAAGLEDARSTVNHPEWLRKSSLGDGIRVYDLAGARERKNLEHA